MLLQNWDFCWKSCLETPSTPEVSSYPAHIKHLFSACGPLHIISIPLTTCAIKFQSSCLFKYLALLRLRFWDRKFPEFCTAAFWYPVAPTADNGPLWRSVKVSLSWKNTTMDPNYNLLVLPSIKTTPAASFPRLQGHDLHLKKTFPLSIWPVII